jgi:membrane fusion protein (multidrug efflux system)
MRNSLRYVLIASLFWSCSGNEAPTEMPLPKVKTVKLQEKAVTLEKDFVGQVYGFNDIAIRTRVEGYVDDIAFKQGSFVKQGDLLYRIDPEPLVQAVNSAQSEVARSMVNNEKAKSDLARIQPLADINAVSKRDLDAAVAAKKGSDELVKAAQANLRLAQIQLDYATIKAPVDGIIGKSLARIGEFVGRSPNPVILNTVSTVDSLRVEFFVTESDYLAWANHTKSTDGTDKGEQQLQLILSDGSLFPHKGRVNFINREVNNITGTILIESIFPNPDRLIRPGQFARVRAAVSTLPKALLIPQRCVNELQGNFFVMRINQEGTVEQVPVKLGQAYRDFYIINDGLSANDEVVYEGLQVAKNGVKVAPELIEFESQYKDQ